MAALDTADMLIIGYLLQSGLLLWTGRALLPLVAGFMGAHGLSDRNYRGDTIPTACGLLVWLLLLVEAAAVKGMERVIGMGSSFSEQTHPLFMGYVLSLGTVAFLGFIDDAAGSKEVKGIAGHWRLWKERRLVSTGLLKAAGIAVAAVVFALQQYDITLLQWGCQTLLLMLMTNGMNLLDLRPGRALKGFFILSTLLLAVTELFPHRMGIHGNVLGLELVPFILPVMIGACVLFGPDLQSKLMIGDTGANLLGFAAGCWTIMVSGWLLQIVLLVLLMLLHGLTWRSSLSKLIERNRLLHWFDLLGRRGRV